MKEYVLQCPECGSKDVLGDLSDLDGWNSAICDGCGHKYSRQEYEEMSAKISVQMLQDGLKNSGIR
ncbi:hypothetical protein [Sodalis sp. RH22]|uniref:hypothetical protein n=1 Tax=unclassified Sodalis (in: enterobacteria) TaxID=2636512 RepID=UPI0039B423E9